jgi:quercetin dioxygenase-like cupin family protein
MVEQVFNMSFTDERTIEKVIMARESSITYTWFSERRRLTEHFSNSNVYMTVLRGHVSIGLDNQEITKRTGQHIEDPE